MWQRALLGSAYAHPTLGPPLPQDNPPRLHLRGLPPTSGSSGECGLSGGDLTDRDVTGTVSALFTTAFGDSVTDLRVGLQANEPRLCLEARGWTYDLCRELLAALLREPVYCSKNKTDSGLTAEDLPNQSLNPGKSFH